MIDQLYSKGVSYISNRCNILTAASWALMICHHHPAWQIREHILIQYHHLFDILLLAQRWPILLLGNLFNGNVVIGLIACPTFCQSFVLKRYQPKQGKAGLAMSAAVSHTGRIVQWHLTCGPMGMCNCRLIG